jgi:hypothetical protein
LENFDFIGNFDAWVFMKQKFRSLSDILLINVEQ